MPLWCVMWGKFYFCPSHVNSQPHQVMAYSFWPGPDFTSYRAWAAFLGHVCWHTVCCNTVQLVTACNMPTASLLTLLNGGNIIPCSPFLLIVVFPWFTCTPGPAVRDLGTLLCSTNTACMKMSSNYPVPSLSVLVDIALYLLGCCICVSCSMVIDFSFSSLQWYRNSVVGLDSPAPMDVALICYKARLTSLLVLSHFLIVCFRNFIHAFTSPLLW